MTTLYPREVECPAGHAIFAIEITSTNNFAGDPYAEFRLIDKCPVCDAPLGEAVVVFRDDYPVMLRSA